MRSISSGGQPWSVDSVTELETCGETLLTKSASTLSKRSRLARAQSRHSAQTSVPEASFMPSMYLSTFSDLMPSRL